MSAHEKALELARRLHALVTRGEGGEAFNAQQALDRLLAKHHLSMDDITGEQLELVEWKHKDPAKNRLRMGIIFKILGTRDKLKERVEGFEVGKQMSVWLTTAERVECDEHFSVLWLHMQEELDVFQVAFARAHNLMLRPDQNDVRVDERTPEEIRRSNRADEMSRNIDRRVVHRQLNKAK